MTADREHAAMIRAAVAGDATAFAGLADWHAERADGSPADAWFELHFRAQLWAAARHAAGAWCRQIIRSWRHPAHGYFTLSWSDWGLGTMHVVCRSEYSEHYREWVFPRETATADDWSRPWLHYHRRRAGGYRPEICNLATPGGFFPDDVVRDFYRRLIAWRQKRRPAAAHFGWQGDEMVI